jgi:acetyl/propionyl-CoA carboxylase alpha subunit
MKMLIMVLALALSPLAVGQGQTGSNGPAIDKNFNSVVDPTKNVNDLIAAQAKREDDLRAAEERFNSAEISHVKELFAQSEANQKELRAADSARLEAIRLVDRDDVNKTAATANTAIATLAKQTTDLSTTLAKQVSDTAIATEARATTAQTEMNKRVSSLELASSEGRGKANVTDPAMAELISEMKATRDQLASNTGQSVGGNAMLYLLLAFGTLIIGGLGLIFMNHRIVNQRIDREKNGAGS